LDQFGSIGSILAHTTGTMRIALAARLTQPQAPPPGGGPGGGVGGGGGANL
jgi:hypothetical protein